MSADQKTCFVIMPFSDLPGYEVGHFDRVYEHLIKPSCIDSGLSVVRGDEVKGTNYIAIDILQRILSSDLVVCDLSGKNANVLYELGLRQAFDRPVVLMKDRRTERIFDIQGLRTLEYNESLRVDSVTQDQKLIKQAVSATLNLESHEINSLVRLLGVEKAKVGERTEVSPETSLVLGAIKDISQRLASLEEATEELQASRFAKKQPEGKRTRTPAAAVALADGTVFEIGDVVSSHMNGKTERLGKLVRIGRDGLVLQTPEGAQFLLPQDDPRFDHLTDIPF
jgi:hypothetical protein